MLDLSGLKTVKEDGLDVDVSPNASIEAKPEDDSSKFAAPSPPVKTKSEAGNTSAQLLGNPPRQEDRIY